MFTEIAPGLFTVATRFVEGMNGIIFSKRGALAVDVGYNPDEGDATAAFIRAAGYKPDRVILTHGHSDHVLGGAAFADAEVYASAGTPDTIRRQLRGFAQRQGLDYEALIRQALFPTVLFTGELQIDLGDKQLRLFPTLGHSRDHISLYVLPDRVLYAGDTVVTGIVPAIGDGASRQLETSLELLRQMEIDQLVAGHGSPLLGAEAVRDWIDWEISYLRGLRAQIGQALNDSQSLSRESLTEIVPHERWIADRLPLGKNHMIRRHYDTAEKILNELRDGSGAS